MVKSSFSNQKFGIVSIVFGVASLASFIIGIPHASPAFIWVIIVAAPIGFIFGAISFKTKAGGIGICLNVIAFLLLLSVVFFTFRQH